MAFAFLFAAQQPSITIETHAFVDVGGRAPIEDIPWQREPDAAQVMAVLPDANDVVAAGHVRCARLERDGRLRDCNTLLGETTGRDARRAETAALKLARDYRIAPQFAALWHGAGDVIVLILFGNESSGRCLGDCEPFCSITPPPPPPPLPPPPPKR